MATRKRRRKRHGQVRPAQLIVGTLFVLAAIIVAGRVFVIKHISVTGNQNEPGSRVVELSGLTLGQSIFGINKEAITQSFGRSGAVKLLDVHIAYPDRVELVVREREAVAVINHLGVYILVDEYGEAIAQINALPEATMPVVTGLNSTKIQIGQPVVTSLYGQGEAIEMVLTQLKRQRFIEAVSELNVADLDNIYLMMRSGLLVKLGDISHIAEKIKWVPSSMAELASMGKSGGTLDVTSEKMAVYKPQAEE